MGNTGPLSKLVNLCSNSWGRVDLHGKGMQMFHHKAFVIRWLILFAPILLKLCTVSPVPPFTDNRSFGIRDNYLYGNIHWQYAGCLSYEPSLMAFAPTSLL